MSYGVYTVQPDICAVQSNVLASSPRESRVPPLESNVHGQSKCSAASHGQRNGNISSQNLPPTFSDIIRCRAICMHDLPAQCRILQTNEKDASREAGSFIRAHHHRNDRAHHLQSASKCAECISHSTKVSPGIRPSTRVASGSGGHGSCRDTQKAFISTRNNSGTTRSITTQS